MKYLGETHIPKGSVLSPLNREILLYLGDHPRPFDDLALKFVSGTVTVGKLRQHLKNLRENGHIDVSKSGHGRAAMWSRTSDHLPRQPASEDGATVRGSQYDVMRAPLYQPERAIPHRAGALDHLQAPSLQQGERRAYWGSR